MSRVIPLLGYHIHDEDCSAITEFFVEIKIPKTRRELREFRRYEAKQKKRVKRKNLRKGIK